MLAEKRLVKRKKKRGSWVGLMDMVVRRQFIAKRSVRTSIFLIFCRGGVLSNPGEYYGILKQTMLMLMLIQKSKVETGVRQDLEDPRSGLQL